MYLLLIQKILAILVVAFGVLLGIWVYFVNRRSKLNQATALLFITFGIWNSLGLMGYLYLSDSLSASLFIFRLEWTILPLSFIFAYFFSVYFPRESKRFPFLDKIVIGLGVIFSFLALPTNWIIKNIGPGKVIEFGKIGYLEIIIMIIPVTLLITFNLFKEYFLLTAKERMRINYFLIGTSILIITNLIVRVGGILFGYYSPSLEFIPNFSLILFFIFTFYAIAAKELFGIKVILTQLLVTVMGIVLFVTPFLIDILWSRILLFVVFSMFCVFGSLLIKSVLREVKQKEILEDKVKERTKELQTTYEEIKQEKERLERLYKATVGRELRMIELKGEIKKNEEEIRKMKKQISG